MIRAPAVVAGRVSADGTRKWLFKRSTAAIAWKTVYIPDGHRGTLCVSIAGRLCAELHLLRDRAAGVQPGIWTRRRLSASSGPRDASSPDSGHEGPDITNVVLMGMGEPLLNIDNVIPALDLMLDDLGFGLARKRVTLSTAGVVPGIRDARPTLSREPRGVAARAGRCAARTSSCRSTARIQSTCCSAACREFAGVLPRQKITFEYVMLDAINDTPEHARRLARRLGDLPAKVNLIPFNPFPGSPLSTVASRGDRPLQGHPSGGGRDDHHPQDPGRRHRCGLRPARGTRGTSKPAGRRDGAECRLHRRRRTPDAMAVKKDPRAYRTHRGPGPRARICARPGRRRT